MKRERRHELHSNALRDWLAETIRTVQPYTNAVLGGLLVVVLVFVVVVWWRSYASTGTVQTWETLHRALNSAANSGNVGALDDVVDRYPGTDVARWAAVLAADTYLREGCNQVLTSKAIANQQLQKAVDHYSTVLKKDDLEPAIRERATFGLARAYEALSGARRSEGELEKAVEMYDEVVSKWPKGAYGAMAARRSKELSTTEVKKFYDQLAQYEPRPPAVSSTPGQGLRLNPDGVPEEPLFQKHDLLKDGPAVEKPPMPKVAVPAPKEPPAKAAPASDTKPATPPAAKSPEPAPAKGAEAAPVKTPAKSGTEPSSAKKNP